MTAKDLACYRTNYDPKGWEKIWAMDGHRNAPGGAIYAIKALCDEVEQLNKRLEKMAALCAP